jgi:hypothetical protein
MSLEVHLQSYLRRVSDFSNSSAVTIRISMQMIAPLGWEVFSNRELNRCRYVQRKPQPYSYPG